MKRRTEMTRQGFKVLANLTFAKHPWFTFMGRVNHQRVIEVRSGDTPPRTIATFWPANDSPKIADIHANLFLASRDMLDALKGLVRGRYPDGNCHKGICSEADCNECSRHRRARQAIALALGMEFSEPVSHCNCWSHKARKDCPEHGTGAKPS